MGEKEHDKGLPRWVTQLLIYAVVAVVSGAGGNAWGTRGLMSHTNLGHPVTLERLSNIEDRLEQLATKADILRLEERLQSLTRNLEPITAELIRRGVLN